MDFRQYLFFICFILSFSSCNHINETLPGKYEDLELLPADTGGIHSSFPLGSTSSPYGFYFYEPRGYDSSAIEYPLLVFLHGAGEKGDSSSNASALDLVLKNGPPKLIERDLWSPEYPMLVASPQSTVWWNSSDIHSFIGYLIETYRVDESRIYLTGLSMGGYGTYHYLTNITENNYVAAAVPICGQGNIGRADLIEIPLWSFHGDADGTVAAQPNIDMVKAINETDIDVKAKITIFPGVGHNSWSRTYDGSGMGTEDPAYDAFNMDIYSWMFMYKKD